MFTIIYSPDAIRDLHRLEIAVVKRIAAKMEFFAAQSDPTAFARRLTNRDGEFRFRIGDYRVIAVIEITPSRIIVLHVGNRKDIYDE